MCSATSAAPRASALACRSVRAGSLGGRIRDPGRFHFGFPIAQDSGPVLDPARSSVAVQVLVEHDLKAGGVALARDDRRPGEKEVPDAKPAFSVLGHDFFAMGEPVVVPFADCPGV